MSAAIADPFDLVRKLVGTKVTAVMRRTDGRVTTGKLVAIDEHGNVVLGDVEERCGGATLGTSAARYIRGDDVIAITSSA